MKKLGLIVNPLAGLGGRVGLKGSDGLDIQRRARELGARPESNQRAAMALKALGGAGGSFELISYPGEMGEDACRLAGLTPRVVGSIHPGPTTGQDTEEAARLMLEKGVDLLLFAGGDGTARNIQKAVGLNLAVLGIPAGVKIHSAVFALTPAYAGRAAADFLQNPRPRCREAEVMDIDESAFRQGSVSAKLYGYLLAPDEKRYVQGMKCASSPTETDALTGMAAEVEAIMQKEPESFFLMGTGTTVRAVMDHLGLENTLLGIDVVQRKKLVAQDVNEKQILEITKGQRTKIVVTPIGGQGHIFGRGNQQLSPRVIEQAGKENIIVVATMEKLASLGGRPLMVDTGDSNLDRRLFGYIRVVMGRSEYAMYKVGQ